jgi:hypothetical protein
VAETSGTRNEASQQARWVRYTTQIMLPLFAAGGITVGVRQADLAEIATLREELKAHDRSDQTRHDELSRLLDVGTAGFRDARIYHAVAEQIRCCTEDLQRKDDFKRWRAQLQQLNRDLVLPAGE